MLKRWTNNRSKSAVRWVFTVELPDEEEGFLLDEENIPRCNKYYVTCIYEIIFKYKFMLFTHLLKLTNLAFQGRTVADSHAFYLGKVHCRLLIFILSSLAKFIAESWFSGWSCLFLLISVDKHIFCAKICVSFLAIIRCYFANLVSTTLTYICGV